MSKRSRVVFCVADASHDAAIRDLLREMPMQGNVRLALEREPDYFDSLRQEGGESRPIVAIDGHRVVCMGCINIRRRYINGMPMRVGYLGQLRLAASHANRVDILQQGFAFFQQQREAMEVPVLFTSIAADNHRARRFLERGVRGMPTYSFAGELRTYVIAVQSLCGPRRHEGDQFDLNASDTVRSGFQFAPVDGCAIGDGGARDQSDSKRTAHVWDQRPFKQVVVRGYSSHIRVVRPLYNLLATPLRMPRLPAVGQSLSCAFVTDLAVEPNSLDLLDAVLSRVAQQAGDEENESLIMGFDARDPRGQHLAKRHRAWVYTTRIYRVKWPDEGAEHELDGRLLYPDVSLL